MKIYILFKSVSSPAGGGNQFLKSLKNYLQSIGAYEENACLADVVLFNSHHHIAEAAKLKRNFPGKVFIHRIDGPMKIYNNSSDKRDNMVFSANKLLADATVFQSSWSQQKNHELELPEKSFETVIHNATDGKIFNRNGRLPFSISRKIKLIAASWSANWNKGFETYKWLDENLDFSKYQMVFIGSSPVKFRNIEHIPPVNSSLLAEKFKQSDIFIFASQIESCSNLLTEAISCGLPVVASNSSSNPEIVADGGELFDSPAQIPALLANIAGNYSNYTSLIKPPSIEQAGQTYFAFMQKVYEERTYKKFTKIDYLKTMAEMAFWKVVGRIGSVVEKDNSK
ncbi:MAG: glycosyltransferase family 4 protein [Phycisphaerae bacterium]|jgi:glycosyltransferase involved in cell wall biosynthesis